MKLVDLIQGMTDKRCKPYYEGKHWFPLWAHCYVRFCNNKPLISNRPY